MASLTFKAVVGIAIFIPFTMAVADGYGPKTIDGVKVNAWGSPDLSAADVDNSHIQLRLGCIWALAFVCFFAARIIRMGTRYLRNIVCLNNDVQTYFARPSPLFSKFQQYLLDAPLFRSRHMREFRLSAALNIGTLPTRFQTVFLVAYVGLNVLFCCISIDWTGPRVLCVDQFRNRTGVLSVMNLIPLFLFSGRNNPLVKLLGINYDAFNLMHRWLGRIVVLEALAHGIAWSINEVEDFGWASFRNEFATDNMIQTGIAGLAAGLAILAITPSVIRHAFYETFLHIHQLLIIFTVGALWLHLEGMPQINMLYGAISLWVFERTCRLVRLVFRNVGHTKTQAELEAMAGDAVRVTLRLARPWKFHPGQHIFLYVPALGWWTSHPFSLAWSQEEALPFVEKHISDHHEDVFSLKRTSMSLIVRRRTGFTEKLFQKAAAASHGKPAIVTAFVEGPYGHQTLDSYGTVLLFAAGVGITHQLPHVRELVAGFADRTTATRQIVLVWIIQSPEHLEWIRPWMTAILGMERRRDVLRILLFVTRPRSTKEIHSPSASVQMFPGKPNVAALVDAEVTRQSGAMCVSVCGTGSLSDEVRAATRAWQGRANVDFVENTFTW